MANVIDPFSAHSEWDTVEVGGRTSPGLCKVSGFKRAFGWEIKKGPGVKGSTTTLNEYPPAEGTLTFLLWAPEHFAQWTNFQTRFMYDATKKTVDAIDVYHPALAAIGVSKIVAKSVSQIESEGGGLFKVVVDVVEFNPPPKKPAVSTPKKSESEVREPREHSNPFAKETAKDASAEQLLANLQKQRNP